MDTEEAQQAAETAAKKTRSSFVRRVLGGEPTIVQWLSLVAGALAVAATFLVMVEANLESSKIITVYHSDLRKLVDQQEAIIERISIQIKDLQNDLTLISNIPKEDALNISIQKLNNSIDDLTEHPEHP